MGREHNFARLAATGVPKATEAQRAPIDANGALVCRYRFRRQVIITSTATG
jgi:hypothetical protein